MSGCDCPFCGRPKDRACRAEKDDIRSEPRDLIKPHGPRLRLLAVPGQTCYRSAIGALVHGPGCQCESPS